jgi:uncharacterized damage-inducible protein DinB
VDATLDRRAGPVRQQETKPRLALRAGAGQALNELGELYLLEYLDKIEIAVEEVGEEAFWERSGPGTNSIANLVLHLCGNLSLWILDGVGGEHYERDRAAEFSADHTASKDELLDRIGAVVGASRRVIGGLDPASMDTAIDVQGYQTDVRGAVFHAIEHMAYHAGQIVLLAKQKRSAASPLEFYPHHSSE